jgi:hypothetical protein
LLDPSEADTAPQPRLLDDTLDLPPVREAAPPADPPRTPRVRDEPHANARRTLPARPPAAGRRRSARRVAVLAAVVVAALLGAAVAVVTRPMLSTVRQGEAAPLRVAAATSYDPSGGSGLRRAGADVWRSQRYLTADFGRLKPGVGLLVDLGTARSVRQAAVTATPGARLELRAADTASPALSDTTVVDRAAAGAALDGRGGGAHRYWLVFVTRLAADGGGYAVQLRGLSLRS